MSYIENPKTKGSGILTCIPQIGKCPVGCEDCFFQSGRSYLEPLEDNLPNIPSEEMAVGRVIRVNDGNDSNSARTVVVGRCQKFPMRFYNTSIPRELGKFDAPVVVTVNPNYMTDVNFYGIDPIPKNLMFVRVRVNTWNLGIVESAVDYYSKREVSVVLTFMAYYAGKIPDEHQKNYVFRKRTVNSYWAITTQAWEDVMARYKYNIWVYSCGKIEGEKGTTSCRHCGNCLREYFATMEKLRR